ncbi:MAG: gamma-glutamylcyclotransferase [Victivallaceae bacterium]|nr:gamma-glutamylcyclotransferase [Victivallaceae bacterium]
MMTELFVYGTLKKEFPNHHYCHNAVNIELATICGRIYQLPPGYPALIVPPENIIAKGTGSPVRDAKTQFEYNLTTPEFRIQTGWQEVHGEMVVFNNPDRDVPPIDRLEGVPRYYERVLLPIRQANGIIIAAWVYIMYRVPTGSILLKSGRWPE